MNNNKLDRYNVSNLTNSFIKKENKYEKSIRNIKEGYISNHVKLIVKKLIKYI
jgi:hypothetical protein